MTLYTLHGFLGRPNDWKEVVDGTAIDLFQTPIAPFDEWAKQFNDSVDQGSVVVGYSLGGRLAMHALVQNPSLWKAAVIISAKTGPAEEDREKRLINDKKWAQRFLTDPWEELMGDWNSQGVFSADKVKMERNEEDFDRTVLSQSLIEWSFAKQQNLTEQITSLAIPILWITGEQDPKAQRGLSWAHPKSREWAAPGIGHRVPWECKELFQEQLQQFLGEIK